MRHLASVLTLAALVLTACDDDTLTVGSDIMPGTDDVVTSQGTYRVTSRSILADSALANTNSCYLGAIVDPETRATTTCDFLAQYHLLDNFSLPSADRLVSVDSCDLTLYFNTYYGDSLTTMKLQVQELDTNRVMEEGRRYYTTIDPTLYVNEASTYGRTMTYTLRDLTGSDFVYDNTHYVGHITVRMPVAYAEFIVGKYREHPEYFRNAYSFIHHVCPGFYFKSAGGVGSMVNIKNSYLNVYFSYRTTTSAGNDTIESGQQSMVATEEVIQNTHVDSSIPDTMLDESNAYSYVKSPAGLLTEVTLPVADIVGGTHYGDTINQAKISFGRYNSDTHSAYALPAPTTLLMVRKADAYAFFEEKMVPDSKTSYTADYSSAYNAYVFSNIGRLVSLMRNEREAGAGIADTDTEAGREAKYAAWEAENPDWNKVCLIPVSCEYATTTNAYTGGSTKTLLRVRNELGLTSARLQGGPTGSDLRIDVVYSRFE